MRKLLGGLTGVFVKVVFVFTLLFALFGAGTYVGPQDAERTSAVAAEKAKDPTAVKETAVLSASKIFGAHALAYSEETLNKEILIRKLSVLESDARRYEYAAKNAKSEDERAVFAIKAATVGAEKELAEMRLLKIAETEACRKNGEVCDAAIASWRTKKFQAQESFDEALKTIRLYIP